MLNHWWLYIILIYSSAACSTVQPANWILYNHEINPMVYLDEEQNDVFQVFAAYFQKVTGYLPLQTNQLNKEVALVYFKKDPSLADLQFSIVQSENMLVFNAKNHHGWKRALAYFYIHELKRNPLTLSPAVEKLKEVKFPKGFQKQVNDPFFNFRAPYFRETYAAGFQSLHAMHHLEDTWGIWGHNISKAVKIIPEMYALSDGERVDEQWCFSSPELENALVNFIQKNQTENPLQKKYMIMPEDNGYVCTCPSCSKLGNAPNYASPAVFTLINKLAKRYKDLSFFSTAYITTQEPPKFRLENNTGVMMSTMAYPKGVVIENTQQRHRILNDIQKWKRITNDIYLWDYAIHFDNYLGIYPTIIATQRNLQWYHRNGITGVFIHGSEEAYAAFSPMKAFVYAQLLQNPNYSVYDLVTTYFSSAFPKTGAILSEFYLDNEERSVGNAAALDFYGGWKQDLKKYLQPTLLWEFVRSLEVAAKGSDEQERKLLSPIFASLYYQQLELARMNGAHEFGYLEPTNTPNEYKVKPEIQTLLAQWRSIMKEINMVHLNESRLTVDDYIKNWQKELLAQPYKNELFNIKLNVTSELDEGYLDVRMLTDGAKGFYDYFNNWLLSTTDPLRFEFQSKNAKTAHYVLEMGFFNQPRHRIFYPEKVKVWVNGELQEFSIDKHQPIGPIARQTLKQTLLVPQNAEIKVQLVKQSAYERFTVACDEVQWYSINN